MERFVVVLASIIAIIASARASSYNDHFEDYRDRCTALGVGPKATVDGSTIVTHNNDCQECDFRITHVPARDWPKGSKRPIYSIRNAYPRYVESPEGPNVHGPDYVPELLEKDLYSGWKERIPIAWIDQVPHTYAYTLGTYAIQNEKQVSIGESTCSGVFVGKPVHDGGNATLAMEGLTELALERCDTARCAIQVMGHLAEKYGFYGPEWNGELQNAQDEAGEGLTVSDPDETWVFHILPDDTGTSAIWVAQRVPDDHITVIANQFTITHIDLNDRNNFMGSSNVISTAVKHNLWNPERDGDFNFALAYGNDRHKLGIGCTRRVWRVFTLAAPSLLNTLSPYTDGLQTFGYGSDLSQPYPFSVKVDNLLTVQDVMNIKRDQFEGSPFDLTTGTDAGMFGDPMRFPPRGIKADPVNGITREQYSSGNSFERPISLWRTAYSSVTQSRRNLPDVIGGVVWVAPYAPHFSTYVPIYASAPTTPSSMKAGTQCNYLSRWYYHTISDVKTFQKAQEQQIFDAIKDVELQALSLMQRRGDDNSTVVDVSEIKRMLETFQETTSTRVLNAWWDFFFLVAGRYRDMYKVVDLQADNFITAYSYLTVPRSWLELIGFWGQPGSPPPGQSQPLTVRPVSIPTEDSIADYTKKYSDAYTKSPFNMQYVYKWPYNSDKAPGAGDVITIANHTSVGRVLDFVIGIVVGCVLAFVSIKLLQRRNPYLPLR